ncbi:MAG: NAD(P)-dependent oxidoreductase [Blautia wexlerae]
MAVVSLHMPFMPSTARIINKSLFERMKSARGILVNTCRGGVIDEADSIEALKQESWPRAELDVLTEEPPKAVSAINVHMDNVYITSSYGQAASLESEYRSQVIIADNIKRISWKESFLKVSETKNFWFK